MAAWRGATPAERTELLETLLGKDQAGSAKITECINEASAIRGHADLPIATVAKACAASANQPI